MLGLLYKSNPITDYFSKSNLITSLTMFCHNILSYVIKYLLL